jgi:hypothetical protein
MLEPYRRTAYARLAPSVEGVSDEAGVPAVAETPAAPGSLGAVDPVVARNLSRLAPTMSAAKTSARIAARAAHIQEPVSALARQYAQNVGNPIEMISAGQARIAASHPV